MDLDRQAPRITAICATILAAIATGAALYWLRPVLVPFVLAVFLSIVAEPVVDAQIKGLRLPRAVAIVTTLMLGIGLVLVFATIVAAAVVQLRDGLDSYLGQLRGVGDRIEGFLARFGVDQPRWIDELLTGEWLGAALQSLLGEVVSLLSQLAIVLIFLYFLLSSHAVPLGPVSATWTAIRRGIAQYLSLHVGISLLTAVVVGTILAVLGVPLALAFAFLVFILNFVPNVGSIIATLLPLPVLLGTETITGTTAILAIALPSVAQFTIGQILEPKLMGKRLDLHPVAVLLGLMFWGMLWGLVGVLLAVPMTQAIKIVLMELGYTKPVADLLAGDGARPAAPPRASNESDAAP